MGLFAWMSPRRFALAALSALLLAGAAQALDEAPPPEGGAEEGEAVEIIEVALPAEESGIEGAEAVEPGETLPPGTEDAVEEKRAARAVAERGPEEGPEAPEGIRPRFVRTLGGVQRGRNDSNPLWSPAGDRLAFERSTGDKKEIVIASPEGQILHRIYYQQSGESDDFGFLLPGFMEEASYNSGISWSPDGDRFVFMSNGGTGNYDLYLSGLGGHNTTRLTEGPEKDGHAHWSPVDDRLVFVSGRTGKADVHLMDLATGEVTRLTRGEKSFLYPQWSPDGAKVAMIYGSNENHDIYLIGDVARPGETLMPLTLWPHDDLRPVWSPDGKKLAFYSNYNERHDPKGWSLMVVAADGSDPRGEGLVSRVVATDVVPDIERGPAWMPDSRRIVYVKNDRYAYNPLFVVDVDEKAAAPLMTGTRMNHDVVCSADGAIAFRAQVEQWDRMFVAKLEE